MSFFMKAVGNPFMKLILKSPLHQMMSNNTAVISVPGRKTGRIYSFPVNYQREGDTVWIVSMRDRRWWKNLREGARVSIRLAGLDIVGQGDVFETQQEVEIYLREYLLQQPSSAKYFDVGLDEQGEFAVQDLIKASENRVMVRVRLA